MTPARDGVSVDNVSPEARAWAIEQIRTHGHFTSLDDLLMQAEKLARRAVNENYQK